MLEIKVTQDQIKQLAMDWYKPIMAEIKAEKESPGEEVATESIQTTQESINTDAA